MPVSFTFFKVPSRSWAFAGASTPTSKEVAATSPIAFFMTLLLARWRLGTPVFGTAYAYVSARRARAYTSPCKGGGRQHLLRFEANAVGWGSGLGSRIS